VEAEVQGASQIAQDALHRGEVGLSGIMHIKSDLPLRRRRCKTSEHQVLKGHGEVLELSWISNRRPRSDGDLDMRVHKRRDQLAVHHTSVLNDAENELTLSEEGSIGMMLYGNP
jgi:hypothetical protein